MKGETLMKQQDLVQKTKGRCTQRVNRIKKIVIRKNQINLDERNPHRSNMTMKQMNKCRRKEPYKNQLQGHRRKGQEW
jgi:hypothetical protein